MASHTGYFASMCAQSNDVLLILQNINAKQSDWEQWVLSYSRHLHCVPITELNEKMFRFLLQKVVTNQDLVTLKHWAKGMDEGNIVGLNPSRSLK